MKLLISALLFISMIGVYGYAELVDGGPGAIGQAFGETYCESEYLCVSFLDVGQGDATFVESPEGMQVLIDGGADSSVLRALSDVMSHFDRDLDLIIATHLDRDHIGGLIDVLDRYTVHSVLLSEGEHDTPTAEAFLRAVEAEGAEVFFARSDQSFLLGGSELLVLFPDRDVREVETNTASLALQIVHDETSFLLTGDAPASVETYLVYLYGDLLKSDVLQVGHHGSNTSSDEDFLKVVDPEYAVISAGKDNSYGHPHDEVVERLLGVGSIIKNTANDGSIHFLSDGNEVKLR